MAQTSCLFFPLGVRGPGAGYVVSTAAGTVGPGIEQCGRVPGSTLSLPSFFLFILFFNFTIIDLSDPYKNKAELEINRNGIGRSKTLFTHVVKCLCRRLNESKFTTSSMWSTCFNTSFPSCRIKHFKKIDF